MTRTTMVSENIPIDTLSLINLDFKLMILVFLFGVLILMSIYFFLTCKKMKNVKTDFYINHDQTINRLKLSTNSRK